jgi:hypothetical protein
MLCFIFRKNPALVTAWDFCVLLVFLRGFWKKWVVERGFLMVRTWWNAW